MTDGEFIQQQIADLLRSPALNSSHKNHVITWFGIAIVMIILCWR